MESPKSNDVSRDAGDPTEPPEQASTAQSTADNGASDTPNGGDEANATPARKPRRRGRQAKDPLGQSIFFKVQRAEDMEKQLREYLANPTGDPEHTTLEFSFPTTAAFMVSAREPIGSGAAGEKTPYLYSAFNKTAVSVVDALHATTDPKEQMLMQKQISKSLVETVQQADGFRYSFHNHWISREDQASRFSYYCNDSVLNKGRAANAGAAKIRLGVKIRKPVYECQGLISIKFSVTKNSLELHYKHVPLHPTFEERAPIPRKDSRRRKLLEIFHPEKLPKPQEKKRKSTPPTPKQPKKKRRATAPLPENETGARPQNARESSLQPLFDFLGSAGRLEEERPANGPSESAETGAENAPVGAGEDNTTQSADGTLSKTPKQRKSKTNFPGMMSGYVFGEEITWGRRGAKAARRRQSRGAAVVSGEATTANSTSEPPPATGPAAQPPPAPPASEVDLLKAKLQEAERKIQDLEAERRRESGPAPVAWTPPQHPGPAPLPPPPHPGAAQPYYPPPPQYSYPPPQFYYPTPLQHMPPPQGPHPPRFMAPTWPPPQSMPPRPGPALTPPGPHPNAHAPVPVAPSSASPLPAVPLGAPPTIVPTPSPGAPPIVATSPASGGPSTTVNTPTQGPAPASTPGQVPTPTPASSQPPPQPAAPMYGFVPSPAEIAASQSEPVASPQQQMQE
ncbi:hypothetical protein ABEF93_004466 [Exophiala dermatitidis]